MQSHHDRAIRGGGERGRPACQPPHATASSSSRRRLAGAAGQLSRPGRRGKGALTLPAVEQPAANVVTARCDRASVRYDFGRRVPHLHGDERERTNRCRFFVALDRATAAAGRRPGRLPQGARAPGRMGRPRPSTAAADCGLSGGTRDLGCRRAEPNQICYAGLAPRGTRTVVLEVGRRLPTEPPGSRPERGPWSPRRRRRLRRMTQSFVCVVSMEDMKERVVFSSPDRWDCPIWAPDGQSLLCSGKGKFVSRALTGGPPEDFRPAPPGAGQGLRPLGRRQAAGLHQRRRHLLRPRRGRRAGADPAEEAGYIHGWSPDGRTVVYTASRNNGPMAIYGRLADGGEETRTAGLRGLQRGPDFSPDGKWIYFTCDKSGKPCIWRMPAAGAGPDDALAAADHQRRLPRLVPAPVAGRQVVAVPVQPGERQRDRYRTSRTWYCA